VEFYNRAIPIVILGCVAKRSTPPVYCYLRQCHFHEEPTEYVRPTTPAGPKILVASTSNTSTSGVANWAAMPVFFGGLATPLQRCGLLGHASNLRIPPRVTRHNLYARPCTNHTPLRTLLPFTLPFSTIRRPSPCCRHHYKKVV
jgi:hypothetical protein